MKVAVMQPYTFPYLGYFQLVHAVDTFVFADDVNFIKNGWINRNKILLNNKEHLLSFPCIAQSQNKMIKEVKINMELKAYKDILITLRQAYKSAPYFKSVFPILETVFENHSNTISELATKTVITISEYLKLETKFLFTSINFQDTKGLDKSERLVLISKELGSDQYINPIGGKDIYDKSYFKENGIALNFIETGPVSYDQFNNVFVPGLSMIDVLMFNSIAEINLLLNSYKLV